MPRMKWTRGRRVNPFNPSRCCSCTCTMHKLDMAHALHACQRQCMPMRCHACALRWDGHARRAHKARAEVHAAVGVKREREHVAVAIQRMRVCVLPNLCMAAAHLNGE